MNYEEAKTYRNQLEEIIEVNTKIMNSYEKNSIGITPDHIRELPEWQQAKNTFEKYFAELRNFNGWFVKQFKKEILADRKNRFKRAN